MRRPGGSLRESREARRVPKPFKAELNCPLTSFDGELPSGLSLRVEESRTENSFPEEDAGSGCRP